MFHKNGHPLTPCQRFRRPACARRLIAAEGTSSSASPTPAVSANTTAGSWAEAFPPKLENAILQAMKQKLVHLKLPIGTDSCGPFSFYSVGEFGP